MRCLADRHFSPQLLQSCLDKLERYKGIADDLWQVSHCVELAIKRECMIVIKHGGIRLRKRSGGGRRFFYHFSAFDGDLYNEVANDQCVQIEGGAKRAYQRHICSCHIVRVTIQR